MKLKVLKSFFTATLLLSTLIISSTNSFAQANQEADIMGESLGDLSLVFGVSMGGAILGLSTLSFVDEPKDHLKNVVVGGAVGIIVGVAIVAWKQAEKSQSLYIDNAYILNRYNDRKYAHEFSTKSRKLWHQSAIDENFYGMASSRPQMEFSFSF